MRIVSVFGPFQSRALVEMDAQRALELTEQDEAQVPRAAIIDAALGDVESIRARDQALGDSALAATLVTLAMELANPYNSATSKAACAKAMMEAMEQLRSLVPPAKANDKVDDLERKRSERRAAVAASS